MYFYKKQTMHLHENDLVALISPAGFLSDPAVVTFAQNLLKKWGLRSYAGTHALHQAGHFAGTDAQRLDDLQEAINNPEVKMIWALRGGYGSIRIVDQLDLTPLQTYPKLLMGFSDITILHQKWQQAGYKSIHGFMPVQLKDKIDKDVVRQTKNALFGRDVSYQFNFSSYNSRFKDLSGKVIGGNLANLYSLLGTDLDFDTKDKILMIEDIGEQLYQIDRMMIALKKAGKLQHLKALVVGQFTDIPENEPSFGKTYQEIILEHTIDYDYPVIFEAPIGHIIDNYPLILGHTLSIKQAGNNIQFHQNGLA